MPEVNYAGQFAQLLKTHYQNVEFTRLNVYGGQPFSVARMVEAVVPVGAPAGRTAHVAEEAAAACLIKS